MAYGSLYPVSYSPMYVQSQPQPQMQPQPQNNGLIWVQGEAGAKSYLISPNTTMPLWDSESQTIYLKSADASGMPTMKILDYTIREQNNQPTSALMQSSDYVTHDELSDFEKRIKELIKGGNDNESAF